MIGPAHKVQNFTIPEFLAFENASLEKHEYYRGEIFAMSGNKVEHNWVTTNLLYELKSKLNGTGCNPFGSDLRIHIQQNTLFTYPDISIICGEIQTLNNDGFNVLNPSVLIEVISESTKNYDRQEKFELYKAIPTFKEYIIINPEKVEIEQFVKSESGNWSKESVNTLGELHIQSVGVILTTNEIYNNTKAISRN